MFFFHYSINDFYYKRMKIFASIPEKTKLISRSFFITSVAI